ncbi:ROK family transcriptional regulator [Aneurinibacillus tyrosinisolvens]|uniref:ROK family transcriptional regulator n=1 Tax=Aneurinibacillus tyrosinisolvens TaxID=1443435 RepID=UPI00063FA3C6|nr:ROK family transcriptional regulator [Aneurinibacillus tyrosinisolvens]
MLPISRKIDVKQSNKLSVLQFIRHRGETTQPEISRELSVSRPTVSTLVDELISEGYIRVTGIGTSTDQGGKRPKLIAFNPRGGGIIALHLTVNMLSGALLDLSANLLFEQKIPMTPRISRDHLLTRILQMTEHLFHKAEEFKISVRGIGVGCPGLIETSTGTILTAANFEAINNFPIGDSLASRFQTPVWVDNECRNLGLAEKIFGLGQDVNTFVSLMTDIGIGAGIIIDNQILRGKDDSFGEVGHATIQMDGPLCQCGNRGCWEVYASSNALLTKVAQEMPKTIVLKNMIIAEDELSIQRIIEAIEKGDTVVEQMAIDELGKYLGVGITNLVNAMNPELIVIHGEMVNLGQPLLQRIEREIQQRALPVPKARVRIKFSELGREANIIGSGALVLQELFNDPEYLFSYS